MNFDLDDDQRMLKDSVDRLFADTYSLDQRRAYASQPSGFSTEIWAKLSELGLLALPFSEDDGGLGFGPVAVSIVMEAVGRALALEPYLTSIVLSGALVRHGARDDQRLRLIAGLVEGRLLLTLAHAERASRYDLAWVETRATPVDGGFVLDGVKTGVVHGDSADRLIVSARLAGAPGDRDGLALFDLAAAAPGVRRSAHIQLDGRCGADIDLIGVRVEASALIGPAGGALPLIERAVDETIAALCAEAVGAMQALLDLTVEYLKTRRQFGVPIGSFQALQHRAADMAIALEQARSFALYATMMAPCQDADARGRAMHAAKVQISRSARFLGQQAVQLHGGIGLTDEYAAGHYFKRLTMIELAFGDADHHLALLTQKGGLGSLIAR